MKPKKSRSKRGITIVEPINVVNNPGRGACGYYAFGWGLLNILRSEQEQMKEHSLLRDKLKTYIQAYNVANSWSTINTEQFFALVDNQTFDISNAALSQSDALKFLLQMNRLLRYVLVDEMRKQINVALASEDEEDKIKILSAIALISDGMGALRGDKRIEETENSKDLEVAEDIESTENDDHDPEKLKPDSDAEITDKEENKLHPNAEETDIFKFIPASILSEYRTKKAEKDRDLTDPTHQYEDQVSWKTYTISRLCSPHIPSWWESIFSYFTKKDNMKSPISLPTSIEDDSPLDCVLKAKAKEFHEAEASDLVFLASCFDVQLSLYEMCQEKKPPREMADDYYPKIIDNAIEDKDIPTGSRLVFIYKEGQAIKYKKRDCHDNVVSGEFRHFCLDADVLAGISSGNVTPDITKKLLMALRRPRIEIEHHYNHWVTRFYVKGTFFAKQFRRVLSNFGIPNTVPVAEDRHTDDFEQYMRNSSEYVFNRNACPDDPVARKKNTIYFDPSTGNYTVMGGDDNFDIKEGCFSPLHEGKLSINAESALNNNNDAVFMAISQDCPDIRKCSDDEKQKEYQKTKFDYWLEYHQTLYFDYSGYIRRKLQSSRFASFINSGCKWKDWQDNGCALKCRMDRQKALFENKCNNALASDKVLWEKAMAALDMLITEWYQADKPHDTWPNIETKFKNVLAYVTLYEKMEASIELFQAKENKVYSGCMKNAQKETSKKAAATAAKKEIEAEKTKLAAFLALDQNNSEATMSWFNDNLATIKTQYENIMRKADTNPAMGHVCGFFKLSNAQEEIKAIMAIGEDAVNEASEKVAALRKMVVGQ